MSKFTMTMVLAIAALGIYAAVKQHIRSGAIADHGVPAVAQIVSLETKQNTVSHLETGHMVGLRYRTAKGEEVNTRVSVSSDLAHAIQRGAVRTVNVRYLPESASEAEIVDDH
jgi:hypothetical protein